MGTRPTQANQAKHTEKSAPENEVKWHPLTEAAAMWKPNVCTFSGRTERWNNVWLCDTAGALAGGIRYSVFNTILVAAPDTYGQNFDDEKRPFQYAIIVFFRIFVFSA